MTLCWLSKHGNSLGVTPKHGQLTTANPDEYRRRKLTIHKNASHGKLDPSHEKIASHKLVGSTSCEASHEAPRGKHLVGSISHGKLLVGSSARGINLFVLLFPNMHQTP